ncbi:hypothetical protein K2X33_10785 [bacterium]|nr:hypothetical protein [bacterium]
MRKRIQIWVKHLQAFVDRAWYFPTLGLLAAIDLFILIIPTDALLVSSVMLRQRKWVSAALWVALGSSLGSAILAGLIQWDTHLVMDVWFPGAFGSEIWRAMDAFFDKHGALALALIAFSPLVQFPAVAIAALSGMPPAEVFFFCLLGRTSKAMIFSWVASFAPRLLLKVPGMRQELAFLHDPQ